MNAFLCMVVILLVYSVVGWFVIVAIGTFEKYFNGTSQILETNLIAIVFAWPVILLVFAFSSLVELVKYGAGKVARHLPISVATIKVDNLSIEGDIPTDLVNYYETLTSPAGFNSQPIPKKSDIVDYLKISGWRDVGKMGFKFTKFVKGKDITKRKLRIT